MSSKSLLWRIYLAYLVIILASIITVAVYASTTLKRFYLQNISESLEVKARIIGAQVSESIKNNRTGFLGKWVQDIGRFSPTRITITLPSGEVLADSRQDDPVTLDQAGYSELKKALAGKKSVSIRFSRHLQKKMIYVAIPILSGGEILGAVRTSLPVTQIHSTLKRIFWEIGLWGLFMTIIAALISLYVSRRITRPMEEIKEGARRFARGELTHRVFVPDSGDLGELGTALNDMAKQLYERIRETIKQGRELEAILSDMREGVIAVDTEERIIMLNQSAASLLHIDISNAKGRTMQETIRNADIQRFLSRLLSGSGTSKTEVISYGKENKYFQISGAQLRDNEEQRIGVVAVLNDVTRLRRLEDMRRDFVANVSHELRTPITSIKGFVETLGEGVIDDKENAKRFLNIISKQTDRLNSIIEDLLTLSRIEQGLESGNIKLQEKNLKPILESAVANCGPGAKDKDLSFELNCDEKITVKANARLLEQALINLLHNAVQYSEQGGSVEVNASKEKAETTIKIRDHGCGIPAEHLSRIFERFYRVDKARSRELGGTGLGLAIVKHITQSHGGYVTVESTPGKGSIFCLHLPPL